MDDKDLQILLKRWREWSNSDFGALGYCSNTIEFTLMNEGMVIKSTGNTYSDNPDCELLDHAIAIMPKNLKKIIKMKYLYGWTNKDAALTLKMALPTYKDLIMRSRMWLCGKLS